MGDYELDVEQLEALSSLIMKTNNHFHDGVCWTRSSPRWLEIEGEAASPAREEDEKRWFLSASSMISDEKASTLSKLWALSVRISEELPRALGRGR